MARRAGARRAPKRARTHGPHRGPQHGPRGSHSHRKPPQSATENVAKRIGAVGVAAALLVLGTLLGVGLGTDRTTLSLFEPDASSSSSAPGSDSGSETSAAPVPTVVVPGVVFDQRILTVAELTRKYAKRDMTLVDGDPMQPTTFVISSFNILGSSHTGKKGAAAGPARAARAGALVRRKGVSVVGLQEFQSNQIRPFLSAAGGFQAYPGSSQGNLDAENSIAWDPGDWELVRAHTHSIPYFGGKGRNMPYVLLRNLHTGRMAWFSNYHNAADVHGPAQRWREAATAKEAALVRELTADGTPMFTTGDMNERGSYACRFSAAGMHSADGVRTVDGACQLVGNLWIDWIWGSAAVTFDDYERDYSPRNGPRISDHPIITATATIEPAKDNEKCAKHVRDGKAYYFCPDPTADED